MEHISKNITNNYNNPQQQLAELNRIKAEIFNITGINPTSVKLNRGRITISVNNQYEAIELRNNRLFKDGKYKSYHLIVKLSL